MKVTIEHFDGKYPSFNVNLHAAEGAEPFLSVKGCRIVDGKNGPFVSWPATKNEKTGKYWNHVYGGEKFNEHVLKLAATNQAPKAARPAAQDDDIPF